MPIEKRGKGHEQHHVHKEETAFKVTARRNKLTGLWAAGLLGLSGDDADAYAKEVVLANLQQAGDQDMIDKIMTDLKARQVATSEAELRDKIAECEEEARRQIVSPG